MEITWYGHSCFRLAERGKPTIITDPFSDAIGIPSPKLKGDIATISHDVPGHNFIEAVKGTPRVLQGAGEYEMGGVFIMGIGMHNVNSPEPRPNVSFLFDYDGLTVLHLGDLDHIPSQSVIEEIGEINVLLIPVGGGMSLKAAQAAEVVSLIEPFYVVPMHYELPGLLFELEPLDKFLKAMGVSKVQESDMLKVSASDMPDQPQVVVLSAQV